MTHRFLLRLLVALRLPGLDEDRGIAAARSNRSLAADSARRGLQDHGIAAALRDSLKNDDVKRDFARSARVYGSFHSPVQVSDPHALLRRARSTDPRSRSGAREALCAAVVRNAYFVDDATSRRLRARSTSQGLGIDKAEIAAALNDTPVKDVRRREVDAAISCGVFGSPYIVVDGEPFWGADRLEQVERWLATGGWRVAATRSEARTASA